MVLYSIPSEVFSLKLITHADNLFIFNLGYPPGGKCTGQYTITSNYMLVRCHNQFNNSHGTMHSMTLIYLIACTDKNLIIQDLVSYMLHVYSVS